MAKFKVTIDGEVYRVEAPSSDALPEIVDHIRSQVGGAAPSAATQAPVEAAMTAEGVVPELSLSARKTPSPEQPPTAPESPVETTPSGVASAAIRGAGPVAAGAALGAAMGTPFAGVGAIPGAVAGATAAAFGDPIVSVVNRVFGTEITKPTDAIQHLLTYMGVPEAKTEAERLVQNAARAGAESFGVGGVGKAMARSALPMVAKLGQSLAAQPIQQAIASATGSAAGEIAKNMGIGDAGQMLTSVLVGGAASKAAQMVPIGIGKETVAAGVRKAEELGLKPLTSQAFPPSGSFGKFARNAAEAVPEQIPGSAASRLISQEASRKKLIEDTLSKFGADITQGTPVSIAPTASDLIGKRKADLLKLSSLKKNIFQKIDNINPTVPALSTEMQIADELKRIKSITISGAEDIVSELNSLRKDVSRGMSLSSLEDRRKLFASRMNSGGLADISDTASPIRARVYKAINDDIRDHIANTSLTPEKDVATWSRVNAKLRKMVGDLGNKKIRNALNSGEKIPEKLGELLFSKNPSEVRLLMLNLTESGKQKAKAAIFEKLALDSIREGNLSPNAFATNSKKFAASLKGALTPKELDEFNGMISALNATRRAGQLAADPPTGARTLVLGLLGGIGALASGGVEKATATLAGIGSGITLGMLYESKPIMNLFAMLSRVKTASREEQAIAKRIISEIQKLQRDKAQESK